MCRAAFWPPDLLFRFVELLTTSSRAAGKEWRIFAVNAILALAGAMMCFATIYPTPNDAAVSPNLNSVGIGSFVSAFTDTAFSRLVLNSGGLFGSGLILLVCLSFLRRPPALIASLAAFIGLKLFSSSFTPLRTGMRLSLSYFCCLFGGSSLTMVQAKIQGGRGCDR